MGETGIISGDDRVELIEGEIVEMTPIGSEYAGHVDHLNALLSNRLDEGHQLRVRNPIQLGEYSEPAPDFAFVGRRSDHYTSSHPTAGDVALLIEVADTSADDDRTRKVPLYARHGIPVVWLVDLEQRIVEVYRDPGEEDYGETSTVGPGDTLRAESIGLEIDGSSIFVSP